MPIPATVPPSRRGRMRLLVAACLCLGLAACAAPGSDDPLPEPAASAVPEVSAPTAADHAGVPTDAIGIDGAWIRAMAPGAPVAGGFMVVANNAGDNDRLVEIRTPDAARVEIHEMLEVDGVMQMRHLADGLPVAAGAAIELQPGGYHLMFIEPVRSFAAGENVPATLRFERAGEVEVEFKVMPLDSTGPENGHHDHH